MKKLLLFIAMCCISMQLKAQCNATITPAGNTTFCQNSNVLLVASAGDNFQWYKNGVAISGATNDSILVNTAGDFRVLIDSAGCIDTSAVVQTAINPLPAQPGPLTGPSVACDNNDQAYTYSSTAVQGAIGYVWGGVSPSSSIPMIDTTILPTITGYISWPTTTIGAPATISITALNGCGLGQPMTIQTALVGPPQIGGSWTVGDVDVADQMTRVCPGSHYTLFPVLHGYINGNTDSCGFQWYLDNSAISGATGWQHVITRGGNYSVKINTNHCGSYTVQKKVYQDMPNSITISPAGPLSFCIGNATPLTVTFDMTGVSDPMKWAWGYFSGSISNQVATNVYSILPDTSGSYGIFAYSIHTPGCSPIMSTNSVHVTVPPQLEVTQIVDTLFATPGYNSYQWFESGAPIAGATAQKHVLTVDGDYTVEGTFSNGCIETSNSFDPNFMPPPPPGEEEEETEGGVSIYPNPVTNNFTLRATVPEGDATADISITDMTGRVLFKKTVNAQKGIVEEKISMEANIERFCILKVRSKGSNQKASFFKK